MFDVYMSSFIVCLIAVVAMIFAINKYAYSPEGKLTCENYVLSSYLYVVLSFVILAMLVLALMYVKFYDAFIKYLTGLSSFGVLGFMLVLVGIQVGLYFLLKKTNPNNTVALHLIWLIILLISSLTFGLFVLIGIENNTLVMAMGLTILITVITGYIGYNYGETLIPFDYDKYLYYALIVLVVGYFTASFFIKDAKTMGKLIYVLAACSLVIFVLLILSYNKKIRERAAKCDIVSNPPNYPFEAMGLVRKIIIVFKDIIILLGGKKSRK